MGRDEHKTPPQGSGYMFVRMMRTGRVMCALDARAHAPAFRVPHINDHNIHAHTRTYIIRDFPHSLCATALSSRHRIRSRASFMYKTYLTQWHRCAEGGRGWGGGQGWLRQGQHNVPFITTTLVRRYAGHRLYGDAGTHQKPIIAIWPRSTALGVATTNNPPR